MLTTRPRGTNDFLPNQVEKWQFIENQVRQLCANDLSVNTSVANAKNFNAKLMKLPIASRLRLIIRLDYYTRTAFEVVINSVGSAQNAICGGGRYNSAPRNIAAKLPDEQDGSCCNRQY